MCFRHPVSLPGFPFGRIFGGLDVRRRLRMSSFADMLGNSYGGGELFLIDPSGQRTVVFRSRVRTRIDDEFDGLNRYRQRQPDLPAKLRLFQRCRFDERIRIQHRQ